MKLLYKLLFISMFSLVYSDCLDIDNQVDCEASVDCEWHADDMACEDAGHDDHAHCEDFSDQASCESDDHCEWHEGMCEDAHDHGEGDCADTVHFDTDGLALEHHGEEVYSQFQGLIEGSVEVHMNEAEDFSVHFIDNNGNEIEIDESIIECYGLSFNVTDPSIISVEMEEHDDHGDDDHGDDDHGDHEEGHHTFEITGLALGSTTFTISIIHQGHADYTSMPILVNVGEEEDECSSGDVNQDGGLNILDVVQIVDAIISNVTDDILCADYNADGIVNILDIIELIQYIVNTRNIDATEATLNINSSDVTIDADGYIGGVQMTLVHDSNFLVELTENAFVADFNTEANQTILVIVAPESNQLFKYQGNFEILELIVANSYEEIETTVSEMTFSLGAAYPNPFNPTTTLNLTIPSTGFVNVSVYNMVGQKIAELADGKMEIGTYNLRWNADNAASGLYLVKAEYAGNISTQKLMLIK